jgi:hypothetical protein
MIMAKIGGEWSKGWHGPLRAPGPGLAAVPFADGRR